MAKQKSTQFITTECENDIKLSEVIMKSDLKDETKDRLVYGSTYADIAKKFNKNENSVKTTIRREMNSTLACIDSSDNNWKLHLLAVLNGMVYLGSDKGNSKSVSIKHGDSQDIKRLQKDTVDTSAIKPVEKEEPEKKEYVGGSSIEEDITKIRESLKILAINDRHTRKQLEEFRNETSLVINQLSEELRISERNVEILKSRGSTPEETGLLREAIKNAEKKALRQEKILNKGSNNIGNNTTATSSLYPNVVKSSVSTGTGNNTENRQKHRTKAVKMTMSDLVKEFGCEDYNKTVKVVADIVRSVHSEEKDLSDTDDNRILQLFSIKIGAVDK